MILTVICGNCKLCDLYYMRVADVLQGRPSTKWSRATTLVYSSCEERKEESKDCDEVMRTHDDNYI